MDVFSFAPIRWPARASDEPLNTMDGSTDGNTTIVAKRWKKRFLVPIWIAQLFAFCVWSAVAIYAIVQGASGNVPELPADFDAGDLGGALARVGAILLALSCLGSTITFISITLFLRKRLHPVWVLISSIIKLLLASALSSLGSVTELVGVDHSIFWVAEALLMVASLLELIYSAIMTHRWRRGRHDAAKGVFPTPGNPSTPLQSSAPPTATSAHSTV